MCIFCNIINHQIPAKVVFEDEETLAILDISQVTYGHTLVMPKKHVTNILEADEEITAHCTAVVSKLAKQIIQRTHASGCNILNNCSEVAGQSVNHLHFHIIPRYGDDDACRFTFKKSKPQDLDEVLKAIQES